MSIPNYSPIRHFLFPSSLIAGFLAVSNPASAAVLVGFFDFDASTTDEIHDINSTNFSGNIAKGTDSRDEGGSNDIFYGNSTTLTVPNVTRGDGYLRVINTLTVAIQYSAAATLAVQLESLLFDATYTTATNGLTISYRIGTGTSVALSPAPYPAAAAGISVGSDTATVGYDDFGYSLAGVSLNPGQTITFSFSSSSMRLDNIALTGNVIPEPSSALLSICGAALLLIRRRNA